MLRSTHNCVPLGSSARSHKVTPQFKLASSDNKAMATWCTTGLRQSHTIIGLCLPITRAHQKLANALILIPAHPSHHSAHHASHSAICITRASPRPNFDLSPALAPVFPLPACIRQRINLRCGCRRGRRLENSWCWSSVPAPQQWVFELMLISADVRCQHQLEAHADAPLANPSCWTCWTGVRLCRSTVLHYSTVAECHVDTRR